MVFINKSLPIVHRYLGNSNDPRVEVCLGTNTEGGKTISIELPTAYRNRPYFERGIHHDLELDYSDPSHLRIVYKKPGHVCDHETECCAIVTTRLEATAFGNGRVYDANIFNKSVGVIAIAIGNDDKRCPNNNWYDYVLRVPHGAEFYVQWSGFRYGHDCMTRWYLRDDREDVINSLVVNATSDNIQNRLPYFYDEFEELKFRTDTVPEEAIMLEP